MESGLASSNRETRTFLESGAVSVGDRKIADVAAVFDESMFTDGLALMRRGKRNACLLELA